MPGRVPSPQPGSGAPDSLADFINPVLMLLKKCRDPGSGVGLAQGSLAGWPAIPNSPTELASNPLSRLRRRKSMAGHLDLGLSSSWTYLKKDSVST